jgi:DNA-binding NarL/FixJ family response regulator
LIGVPLAPRIDDNVKQASALAEDPKVLSEASPDAPMTVVIADDDSGFRGVLRRMLALEPRAQIVGEAGDGEEAVRLAQRLRPRVVLLDVGMPRVNGLEATRRIKAAMPEIRIVVVTVHGEEAYQRAAAESGADAFVTKKSLATELLPTIRRIVAD